MTAPYVPTSWAVPSGWTDDRLMEAYDLIHQVVTDRSTEDDNLPEIRALLPQIEKADDILRDMRGAA